MCRSNEKDDQRKTNSKSDENIIDQISSKQQNKDKLDEKNKGSYNKTDDSVPTAPQM